MLLRKRTDQGISYIMREVFGSSNKQRQHIAGAAHAKMSEMKKGQKQKQRLETIT